VLRGVAEVARPLLVAANEVSPDRGRDDVPLLHEMEVIRVAGRDEVAEREHAEVFFGVEQRGRRTDRFDSDASGGATA
jgi:hypothetical protein